MWIWKEVEATHINQSGGSNVLSKEGSRKGSEDAAYLGKSEWKIPLPPSGCLANSYEFVRSQTAPASLRCAQAELGALSSALVQLLPSDASAT